MSKITEAFNELVKQKVLILGKDEYYFNKNIFLTRDDIGKMLDETHIGILYDIKNDNVYQDDDYIYLNYDIKSLHKNYDRLKYIIESVFKYSGLTFEIGDYPMSCYPTTKIIPLSSGYLTIKIKK